MPLYAGVTSAVPIGSTSGIPVAWTEDVGTISASWTDPTGAQWPLSDTSDSRGWFTANGPAGWGAQPYEIVTDPMSRGGESVRFIRPKPARITWPLHIWGDTHTQFVARYRALRQAFLMTVHRQLPGTLTVARPDGTARLINAYYEDGWTGEPGQNWLSASLAVTLFCPDGSWQDSNAITETRSAALGGPFNNPFLTLSPSQVIGATTINNPGDVWAWPSWTITGPATQIVATNNTTGQTFTLTYTLTAGQQITITTDRPTVRGPAGQNISGSLNWPTAYLWGLSPGSNNIAFTVAGSTTATVISLSFYPRYEGA